MVLAFGVLSAAGKASRNDHGSIVGSADSSTRGSKQAAPEVYVYKTDIALNSPSSCRQSPCTVSVTVSYPETAPEAGNPPCAVVLLVSGFLQSSASYSFYAQALAQAGLAVVQYDAHASLIPDNTELAMLYGLLEWADEVSRQAGHPLEGRLDLQQLHAAGHSRGGKLVGLLLSGWRPPPSSPQAGSASPSFAVHRALLLDPVDSGGQGGQQGASAVQKLRGLNRTAGVVGASKTGLCNPAKDNYLHFLKVLALQSPSTVLDAGHMQFADTGWESTMYNIVCGAGTLPNERVQAIAADMAVNYILHGSLNARPPAAQPSSDAADILVS
eukprot:CAMPEP_0117666298 /NCGR_PEP_ID=MMETSP0804-20121206/10297_1 /TAXON_ID=1074897 /ORGANISM="Tetraselmis astigmatica, Strain CCMP880" /LENGTH=327 /DNA_ID=CAMNT_0005473825 /DNA_START=422 /DNA_END=1405 /DNA_ORIENTATION=-